MNSAFLGYLVNGNKPSTEGLIYLEGSFHERIPPLTIYSCSKIPIFREITLSASKDALTLVNEGKPESDFKWEGIVGATSTSAPASDFPTLKSPHKEVHILKIHFYAPRKEGTNAKREEFDREFYSIELNPVLAWQNFILQMANNPNFEPSKYKDMSQIPHFRRLLLVFINPNSGAKQAMKAWDNAKPFLRKCGMTFIEVFTQGFQYARDYMLKYDAKQLKEIDGIITVSGDGIPHEVINGVYARPDWQEFKDIPIGALPGGSANALTMNQVTRSKEALNLLSACYLVVKGRTIKSDLTVYEGLGDSKVYSFLSFVYGNMARIDIESERFRALGSARFYVYGVYAIAKLQTDRARITYTTGSDKLPQLDQEIKGEGWKNIDDQFAYLVIQNLAYLDGSSKGAPLAEFDDGYNDLLYVSGSKNSRKSLLNILLKLEDGLFEGDKPAPSTGLGFEKIKAFRFEPTSGGYYSIDGERYDAKKIQGYVLEKALTVYATN